MKEKLDTVPPSSCAAVAAEINLLDYTRARVYVDVRRGLSVPHRTYFVAVPLQKRDNETSNSHIDIEQLLGFMSESLDLWDVAVEYPIKLCCKSIVDDLVDEFKR